MPLFAASAPNAFELEMTGIVYTNGGLALCFLMPDSNSPSMARWRSDDAKALNGLIALV